MGLPEQAGTDDRDAIVRRCLRVTGMVQGVGFRPYVYRLARELGLAGLVRNDDRGVYIELEGPPDGLNVFKSRLIDGAPPLAKVDRCSVCELKPVYDREFTIVATTAEAAATTQISPDIATCEDCLRELFDPGDRRYRYPFINCTNCGPRYTIIESIPYDRPFTSMARFELCSECDREYHDPADRRFHAQPNACPVCGPKLWLEDADGRVDCDDVVEETLAKLRRGQIAAIRGMGGFHLAVDATNNRAVVELRHRKGRKEKPLALMAPDSETVNRYCRLSSEEQALLEHHSRPIVLLAAREGHGLAESIAPGDRYLGFMLPYTPLHHLIMQGNFDALVMTSGNLSEEPIATGNEEAHSRLKNLADFFVLHDREILQRCDDSILRWSAGNARMIRRARGFVPQAINLGQNVEKPILACGGELKNTVAIARDDRLFLSQHIGDLDNPAAYDSFEQCISHLGMVLQITPEVIAHDLHPGYLSTRWAQRQDGVRRVGVQHHHAHLVSVMAENGVTDKTIGVILDGTGLGTDSTIWGGEILVGDAEGFQRHAWLQTVPMPGGEAAIHQPWRMAVSWLWRAFGDDWRRLALPLLSRIGPDRVELLLEMMQEGVNSPRTSSCGRLFDAVSALLGLCHEVTFEAQGAIALEMAAHTARKESYEVGGLSVDGTAIIVTPLIKAVVRDVQKREPVGRIASRFHHTLADLLVASADAAREGSGINRVGLSGGVFQNKLFFEYMMAELTARDFEVLTHSRVPTNDGGLALGQAVIAATRCRQLNN